MPSTATIRKTSQLFGYICRQRMPTNVYFTYIYLCEQINEFLFGISRVVEKKTKRQKGLVQQKEQYRRPREEIGGVSGRSK